MKKNAVFVFMIGLFLSLAACSAHPITAVSDGTYTLKVEDNAAFAPSVTLSEGTFVFTYVQIKDSTLIFDKTHSSPVDLLDERLGVPLSDGDILSLVS